MSAQKAQTEEISAVEAVPQVDAGVAWGKLTPRAQKALSKQGVRLGTHRAPRPEGVIRARFENICTKTSSYPKASGETNPLLFLSWEEGTAQNDFEGYSGYIVIRAIDPELGELMINHSEGRVNSETGEIVMLPVTSHVKTLQKGDFFKVAMIPTTGVRKVFEPIALDEPLGA